MPRDIIGVDIAKSWIDTYRLSTGARFRVETAELKRFAASLGNDCLVAFEASGGYERPLVVEALGQAGVARARINPRQVRDYSRATGRPAGQDRQDRCRGHCLHGSRGRSRTDRTGDPKRPA